MKQKKYVCGIHLNIKMAAGLSAGLKIKLKEQIKSRPTLVTALIFNI